MSCPTKLTLCCTMLEVAVPSQGIYLKIPYEVDGVITILHVVNKASAVPCRGWLSFSAAAMRANSKHSFSKIRIFRVSSIARSPRGPSTILLQNALEFAKAVAASELIVPLKVTTV